MESPLKRPTVADVAREAGVSAGTVSAVLNRRRTVADGTRDHVWGVVDRIGYRPRGAARRLGAREGGVDLKSVGVVVKEDDNPFYVEIVAGARAALAEAGYVTFAASSEGDYATEGRLLDELRAGGAAGAVVAPVAAVDADLSHLYRLRAERYPFVVLEEVRGLQADAVWIDSAAGTEAAVGHLIGRGHRRIAYLAGPTYTRADDRLDGVRRAFSASTAVAFTADVVVPAGAHLEDGYRAGLALFSGAAPAERPTAVVCFNDLVAIGLLRALHELGLSVPGDVSVVGCDDVPAAAYLAPPLTTVRSPARALGRRAAELLLAQIGRGGEPAPSERDVLDAELVVRQSTRAIS